MVGTIKNVTLRRILFVLVQLPMNSFLGCEKAKTLSQKGCDTEKLLKICGSIVFLNCPLMCQFFLTIFHAADQ